MFNDDKLLNLTKHLNPYLVAVSDNLTRKSIKSKIMTNLQKLDKMSSLIHRHKDSNVSLADKEEEQHTPKVIITC